MRSAAGWLVILVGITIALACALLASLLGVDDRKTGRTPLAEGKFKSARHKEFFTSCLALCSVLQALRVRHFSSDFLGRAKLAIATNGDPDVTWKVVSGTRTTLKTQPRLAWRLPVMHGH